VLVVWVCGFGSGAGPSEAGCAWEVGGAAGGTTWTGISRFGLGVVTGALAAGGGAGATGGDSGA
jgi:hypothetical protein